MAACPGVKRVKKKGNTEKKGEVEKKRVKDVRGEYDSLATLLGLCQKRLNKAAILEAAVNFIQKHHEGLDIPPITKISPNSSVSPPPRSSVSQRSAKMPESDSPIIEVVAHSPEYEGLPNTHSAKLTDNSYFLCLEEVDYPDESDEEEIGPSYCNSHELQFVNSISAEASPRQFYGCVPSMAVVISPKSPWLTSSSPHIASVFNANISPPMRQTTPSFHSLSPHISSPVVPTGLYNDGSLPTPPGLLSMNGYDQEHEVCWVSGDAEYTIDSSTEM